MAPNKDKLKYINYYSSNNNTLKEGEETSFLLPYVLVDFPLPWKTISEGEVK